MISHLQYKYFFVCWRRARVLPLPSWKLEWKISDEQISFSLPPACLSFYAPR